MDTETVTRIRAGAVTDPDSGDSVESWAPDNVTEVDIITLAPAEPRPTTDGQGPEPLRDARNSVTSGFTLYLPSSADVTAKDRMRVRGDVYPVKGDPAPWLNAGIVVQTERTEG